MGTLKPPMPQANPIISDDTVAALTGASACPNTTLTGSVDCRKKPPIASTTMNNQPDSRGAASRKGAHRTSDQTITRRGPNRSAAGPPKKPPTPLAKRYAARMAPGLAHAQAPPGQHHRDERREGERRQRPQDDDDVEERQRPRVGPQGAKSRDAVVMERDRRHAGEEEGDDHEARDREQRRPLKAEVLRRRREEQRAHREPQRAAGDVHRHREAAMRRRAGARARRPAGETPRRRGRRRSGRRRAPERTGPRRRS